MKYTHPDQARIPFPSPAYCVVSLFCSQSYSSYSARFYENSSCISTVLPSNQVFPLYSINSSSIRDRIPVSTFLTQSTAPWYACSPLSRTIVKCLTAGRKPEKMQNRHSMFPFCQGL